jgi:hypothetical protein
MEYERDQETFARARKVQASKVCDSFSSNLCFFSSLYFFLLGCYFNGQLSSSEVCFPVFVYEILVPKVFKFFLHSCSKVVVQFNSILNLT